MKRREFLKAAGAASAVSLTRKPLSAASKVVAIVTRPDIEVVQSPSVRWATEQLRDAIAARGVLCRIVDAVDQVPANVFCVKFTSGSENAPDGFLISAEGVSALHVPGLLISAGDPRG